MKIYILDYPDRKISHWHQTHWEKEHEVQHDMYFNIEKVKWADVCVFFWCEPPAQELSRLSREEYPAKRIVQIVDIDAYAGHWGGVDWNNIDEMVFMSKHIQEMVNRNLNSDYKDVPQHVLPLGIDLDAWTYAEHGKSYNVGFLAAEWWSAKNPSMVVQFMAELVRRHPAVPWHFYWSGVFNHHEAWLYNYLTHMMKTLKLEDKITLHFEREGDINEWMEKLDYFVTFSQKDSYSLIVGEAMAKGIKTLCHGWWGAEHVWDRAYIWYTLDELMEKMVAPGYNSKEYRTYIENNHDIRNVLKQWSGLLTTN